MDKATYTPLNSTIEWSGCIPLSWRVVSPGYFDSHRSQLNQSNEQVLLCLNHMEEHQGETRDDLGSENSYLKILDQKITMVMHLLQYYLTKNSQLPPSIQAGFNVNSIHWLQNEEHEIALGQTLVVDVYLNETFPRPLELPCKVHRLEEVESQQLIQCDILPMAENVVDLLEKLIFRHHRRSVATINTTKK